MDDLEDMGIADGDESIPEEEIKNEERRSYKFREEHGEDEEDDSGEAIELEAGDIKCNMSDNRKPTVGCTSGGEPVDISDYDTRSEVSSEPEYDTRSEVSSSSDGEWGKKNKNKANKRSSHKLVNERRAGSSRDHERHKERHKQMHEEERNARHRKSRGGKESTTSKVYDYATKLNYLFRDARFYMIKSNNAENVTLSKVKGVWSTLPMNEAKLNHAYSEARNVLLIFSVKESGKFAGFARLASEVSYNEPPINWVSLSTGDWGNKTAFGGVFKVDWISRKELPFTATSHLYNPWNLGKPVKIGRDGQDIPPKVGSALCRLFPEDETIELNPILRKSKEAGERRRAAKRALQKFTIPYGPPFISPPYRSRGGGGGPPYRTSGSLSRVGTSSRGYRRGRITDSGGYPTDIDYYPSSSSHHYESGGPSLHYEPPRYYDGPPLPPRTTEFPEERSYDYDRTYDRERSYEREKSPERESRRYERSYEKSEYYYRSLERRTRDRSRSPRSPRERSSRFYRESYRR
ncbi:hypothetical protein O3M35_011516 [Rhynocoris fuscipes]|uniref:YTH domain-containing protein n=1 Tax=Rhynocoris fuscipes TaxID=488301 RepID=A0AAW1CYS5_9HEMI